ncbi:VTT domain-containing protein [uncultured Methanofollis sp.]|uniref:VTT domain-containing protein n=1 Tax=uncultured Methanofollis sp. TaxID=262500 RepID=UPI002624886D|nr:VTT domain-containing protein [uncultured Methanofollis sp.]
MMIMFPLLAAHPLLTATLPGLVDVLLNLDDYLFPVVEQYGAWTYALLFAIIFIETGFVVMPFLPGDSLLFVAGAFAGAEVLSIGVLLPLLMIAAFAGDQTNYWIGKKAGEKILAWNNRFIKPEYVRQAQEFFDRHGKISIFLARFVPIVRTFVPFVAGIGNMRYRWFVSYNILGAIAWVFLFVGGGYFFGNIPMVRDNLSLLIILIIIASFAMIGVGYLKENAGRIKERFFR